MTEAPAEIRDSASRKITVLNDGFVEHRRVVWSKLGEHQRPVLEGDDPR